MLRKTTINFAAVHLPLKRLNQLPKPLLALVTALLGLTVISSQAAATLAQLGVVKSQENEGQWGTITNRLRAAGIDFCVIEAADWQSEGDLRNIRVLFLPNVPILNGLQADALGSWVRQGGRLLISGPTGSLSQPEIRSQLRSLFGAYWGFANSNPSTLKLADVSPLPGIRSADLTSTFMGGVIIPTSVNSQTAAFWRLEGKPPAVVITDNSTFLGWRWGVEGVATAPLDAAWLEASLGRYGITRYSQFSPSLPRQASPCNPKGSTPAQTSPIIPYGQEQSRSQQPSRQGNPNLPSTRANRQNFPPLTQRLSQRQDTGFSPARQPANTPGTSSQQFSAMSEELENLIARFASTLLTVEANHSRLNSPKKQTIAQSVDTPDKAPRDTSPAVPSKSVHSQSYIVLLQAKEGLRQFQQLVNQQDYDRARQLWLKTRRSLWDNYPSDRAFAPSEIRAMWLDRGTIVQAKSEADLAVVFDRMAAAGVNTVFFETLNASYPIYPSRIAPQQNPLTQGWDPLKAAVKLAHERGMELHAWFWVFAAANQRHNEILNQPLNYLGPVLSQHPDWAITDKEGNIFDRGVPYKKAFLDPANPEVQRYLLSLLEEVASNYDVDGIQLDYIRYPFQEPKVNQTFGYSQSSRQLFKEIAGVDPIEISPRHPLWAQWTGFRIRQVDSFVATVSERLRQKRPDLILSAAVFPMEKRDRLFRLQQNWEEWVRREQVDMIVLMTYALDTGNLEERTQPLFNQDLKGSSLLVPGLRLLKVPDSVTLDQLQFVRNLPTGGYALFAAENLTPNLQNLLSRTQGTSSSAPRDPLPYRQPFQAASARYQALQREWRFLLANQQLMINEANLKEWGKQTDILAVSLNQLAQQPSLSNYATAKTTLGKFRQQFAIWLRQHKTAQPYQVEVWSNRLATLEQLLVYGERVVLREDRVRVAGRSAQN